MGVGVRLDMVGVGHFEVMLMVVLLDGWPYKALVWCSTHVDVLTRAMLVLVRY